MKTLTTLKSAINRGSFLGIVTLIGLVPVLVPHLALASELQTNGQQSQIFEIKIDDSSVLNPDQTKTEQNLLNIQTIADSDPLVIQLKQYLQNQGSPMAEYADQIILQPQWQRALAISYVESHMGKYCFNNNCSGIGGAPGTKTWRKYGSKLDWFIDLNNVLEKPIYKDKLTTFRQMKGVYVQPGSESWVNGAQAKYDQLMALTQQAEEERRALSQQNLALATFN